MSNQKFILESGSGQLLSLDDFILIIDQPASIELADSVYSRAEESCSLLHTLVEQGSSVYGVTTGFGAQGDMTIPAEQRQALQAAVIEYHGAGVGPVLSERESRAVLLARIVSLAQGKSGVRPALLAHMARIFNSGIAPVIPSRGSVGASGDLTPLSYVAAVLAGKREAWVKGRRVPAADALQSAGIEPWSWDMKEGLALVNGTAVMTALAALGLQDARRLAEWSDRITAAAAEAMQLAEEPFSSWVQESKHHPGQIASAAAVRQGAALQNTEISRQHQPNTGSNIQPRYSMRCAPQANGVLHDTVAMTRIWIERELNSANDNPLFDSRDGRVYHTGNFYGGHISAAADYLRIAIATTANLLDRQLQLLLEGSTGLPVNLVPPPADGEESAQPCFALKALGITTSALSAEVQHLAAPVSLLSRPTESGNQDVVSMGTLSALKLRESARVGFLLAAHTLTAAAQAAEIAGSPGPAVRKLIKYVREDVPLVRENVALGDRLEQLAVRMTASFY
ncbi:aromatic amino acid ammonia-lyase [Spirochaeta africana]|nr:aromatic amino acid ammonia-lyase [Spirochaeta africana]